MQKRGPGKSYRNGITLMELMDMFPDNQAAESWFIENRWPNGVKCAHCESPNVARRTHPTMPYHCRDCRKFFSVKVNTPMHGSKIGYRQWAVAFYLMTTGIKGVSSMKLHRDLGIRQSTAWHMAHRIRETWGKVSTPFDGPTEVDETYIGGRETNKHASKKLRAGRGTVGKTAVVGAKDRASNQVSAQVVKSTDRRTLQGFVQRSTVDGSTVYTDEAAAYVGVPRRHKAVRHSVSQYVDGQAHTNGMESFWALLKRGYHGTYHHLSPKHLGRYVGEFEGRHNDRPMDTADQMASMVQGLPGKRLRYQDLIQ